MKILALLFCLFLFQGCFLSKAIKKTPVYQPVVYKKAKNDNTTKIQTEDYKDKYKRVSEKETRVWQNEYLAEDGGLHEGHWVTYYENGY